MATGFDWGYMCNVTPRMYTTVDLIRDEPKRLMLKQIPKTLKRVLSRDLQAQYKAGLINHELGLTEKGEDELMDILSQEFARELTKRAKEIIEETKEGEKK